jgi:hypothetical protein
LSCGLALLGRLILRQHPGDQMGGGVALQEIGPRELGHGRQRRAAPAVAAGGHFRRSTRAALAAPFVVVPFL